MTQQICFVSDVHLSEKRSDISDRFFAFLSRLPADLQKLYILGDLFEYWIGDDDDTPLHRNVAQALAHLTDHGTQVFYMHGNRDFLIGTRFASACGMTILPDPTVISLGTKKAILMHGDALCTDDEKYQQWRQICRAPEWQSQFLKQDIQTRLKLAEQARSQSASHMADATEDIMDVNENAVLQSFQSHNSGLLIHGHTHRPAQHHYADDQLRIVLGDWYEQQSALWWQDNRLTLTGEHADYQHSC